MQPNEIAALGRMLYGERFTKPLSIALQVSDRTVRNWLAGKFAMPTGAANDLIILAACLQVERMCSVIDEIGALPTEIELRAYSDDADVPDGGLSHGTHRLLVQTAAHLFVENGIKARVVEA